MDAAAALEDGEVVGPALPRDELVPPLTRVAEMRVCINEARHDNTSLGIDLDRVWSAVEILPTVAATRRDNEAVARCDPSAVDRAHIACGRTDPRLLVPERRECEQTSASN